MAMTLSKVQDKTSTVDVHWDDETVEIGYRASRLTPALLNEAQAAGEAGNLDQVGVILEPLLAWWDVLDDDGKRLPTDAATIASMPFTFLLVVMDNITEAMRPPARKG